MNDFQLKSPRHADGAIAQFFANDSEARIEVLEEEAFGPDAALYLGSIKLATADTDHVSLVAAVRNGSFEWRIPAKSDVLAELRLLLGIAKYEKKALASADDRLVRLMDDIAEIAVRIGMSWPRFDALAIADMPFKRPATVVADTSGVLQGALSFVAQHLNPMARLKIPAVLHMEVINQADRFLKTRRSKSSRKDVILAEHMLSQAGQRVLLRLELRDDTEVERNLLIGDPLRNAFREDRDPDLKEMNVNVPLRSYVDRMILESARQHQAYASPGHPVHLLTGDQGLAKMALAEGIKPLFFKKARADQFFGLTLTGTNFSPFKGTVETTSLSALLWELATVFGRARLSRASDGATVEVTAIHKDLGWSAFHSHEDLLWFRAVNLPQISNAEEGFEQNAEHTIKIDLPAMPLRVSRARDNKSNRSTKVETDVTQAGRLSDGNGAGVAFYRLNVKGLISLIDLLANSSGVDDEAVMAAIDLRHPTGLAEYRRFLLSGGFIEDEPGRWVATDRLISLGAAQRERDLPEVAALLSHAPSYAALLRLLDEHASMGEAVSLPIPARVLPSYLALGEITGKGISIPNEGYFPTLAKPDLPQFVKLALERYKELTPDNGWVSTGEWLEALARKDGIHPIRARDALQEAAAGGLIRRFTEGSTTDTRHDDHTVRVLDVDAGRPKVAIAYLYRGDFLMPDKSSSSLRLQAAEA
jgi:hypothetical protein